MWLNGLSSDDIGRLSAEKTSIRTQINELMEMSNGMAPFGVLLRIWLGYAQQSSTILRAEFKQEASGEEFYVFCQDWYRKYIETGLSHIANLPETWVKSSL
jgi:hypothetical protein